MSGYNSKTLFYLRSAFREYYFRSFNEAELPDRLGKREFGFSRFGERGMQRHFAFNSPRELRAHLVKEVPSDVYCSNACYLNPTLSMQEKEWTGASIIFDIDAKDLNLPCVRTHSYSRCRFCQAVRIIDPAEKEFQSCGSCNHSLDGSEVISLPCSKCVEGSREQVQRLLSFLSQDFGIPKESIDVYFSGNNGFHVHVNNLELESLDSRGRLEIIQYITAQGLMPEVFGIRKVKGAAQDFSVKNAKLSMKFGWGKKLANDLKASKISTETAQKKITELGGYQAFLHMLESLSSKYSSIIDPQVTSDVHRIFRLQNTINSKSSLGKVKCIRIADFDPFRDACVLGESKIPVRINAPVKLRLKGKTFKLDRERAELPAFAASYLMCKSLAYVEESPGASSFP